MYINIGIYRCNDNLFNVILLPAGLLLRLAKYRQSVTGPGVDYANGIICFLFETKLNTEKAILIRCTRDVSRARHR